METVRLPLPQILAPRDTSIAKDGILINAYEESTPLGDMIVKRPGLTVTTQYSAGCAQGAIDYTGVPLFIIGDAVAGAPAAISGASWHADTATPKPSSGGSGTTKGGSLVSFGGNLYAFGGRDNLDTTVNVYKSIDGGVVWSLISTPWTTAQANTTQAAVVLNSKMYAFGMIGGRRVYSSSDGITWTLETSDLAGGGTHSVDAVVVLGTTMYALLTNSSLDPQVWSSTNGAAWSVVNSGITALGTLNRAGFLAFGNNLYIIGGQLSTSSVLQSVYRSSDNGATWTLLTSTGGFIARMGLAVWVADSKMWLAAGSSSTSNGTPLNSVYYSFDGLTWNLGTAAASWLARSCPAYCTHNGTMYIGAGLNSSGGAVVGTYDAVVSTPGALTPAPPVPCLPFQATLIPATTGSPVQVFLKNNDVAYLYNGITITKITDTDYPTSTVYGVVYLDGTIYVMNRYGQIFGSDLAAPTSWSALNVIVANAEADNAVALARQLNYVVAFKQYSIEFFYDAGNATGSPLSKVLNALLTLGCASAGSLAFADNTIYFMGNAQQHGRSIQKMEGYTPKYISNQYIDRLLNADSLSEVYSFVVKSNGHFFYVLTLVNTGKTLVFDEVTGKWHVWTTCTANSPLTISTMVLQTDGSILVTMPLPHSQSDGDPVLIAGSSPAATVGRFNIRYDSTTMSSTQFSYFPSSSVSSITQGSATATFYTEGVFPGVYYARSSSGDLLLDRSTGAIYSFSPTVYDDNSCPVNVKIQTALLDFGVMAVKRYNRFELVGDKVTANVYVRYTDEDYTSWSLYRQIQMQVKRAKISNLGSGRRRAFNLRCTDAQPLRLLAAEIDHEKGAF